MRATSINSLQSITQCKFHRYKTELRFTSSTNGSGNSGSAENLSSELNNRQSTAGETSNTASNSTGEGSSNNTTNTSSSNNVDCGEAKLKPLILTESLLNLHNEIMEKLLIQKHKDQKKEDKRNKSEQKANKESEGQKQNQTKLKRSASQSWKADNKDIKVMLEF